jgi:glucosamine 6-phosphate synthetase-like amidotransferase/phosphosugar isomerase protein
MSTTDFMMEEILEQPLIMKLIIEDEVIPQIAKKIQENRLNNIIITGSGDSYCAAKYGSYLGKNWLLKHIIQHYTPYNLVNFTSQHNFRNSVVIGLSVSGSTPRVIEAIRYAKKRGAYTIGITDNPMGKLATESDEVIFIHASPLDSLESTTYHEQGAKDYTGYHHDVAQTKTYLANITALSILMANITLKKKQALRSVFEAFSIIEKVLSMKSQFISWGKVLSKCSEKVIFVGSGANSVTALFGAYKLFEFTLNGYASDIEEYCHTQYFITNSNSSVIFLAPDKASWERIMEIEPIVHHKIGASTLILAKDTIIEKTAPQYLSLPLPSFEPLTPLILVIPIELITYSLARERGFNTNMFRGGQETEKYVAGSFKTIRSSKIRH